MADGAILAVDVGGTFTDAVVVTRAGAFTGKTPTTPDDQSVGVLSAAAEALDRAKLQTSHVGSFVHGMTVTTNALLEGRFAKTALLATAGFTDLEELGRQNRASLYRLCAARPKPIVPARLRFAVAERCGPDGVIEPLYDRAAREALRRCADGGVESIAVCLLFSFRHPEHELRVRELAGELLPGVHVSLSHEVVGTFREYERCATTVIDAALSPLLGGYLARLERRAAEAGLPAPDVMLSNGGTVPAALAAGNASWTVLSGPAGGAVGAAHCARRQNRRAALGLDMGGTSTDIAIVGDGRVRVAPS
ncbi:MAG: hydantoinase/oxoprolinase family protein, partial [Solirubrobacterales bacterium]